MHTLRGPPDQQPLREKQGPRDKYIETRSPLVRTRVCASNWVCNNNPFRQQLHNTPQELHQPAPAATGAIDMKRRGELKYKHVSSPQPASLVDWQARRLLKTKAPVDNYPAPRETLAALHLSVSVSVSVSASASTSLSLSRSLSLSHFALSLLSLLSLSLSLSHSP